MSNDSNEPTPQGDAPPPDGEAQPDYAGQTRDVDAQPPGLYVDDETGPVPEPNEPA